MIPEPPTIRQISLTVSGVIIFIVALYLLTKFINQEPDDNTIQNKR